jgi:UPF0755 protein
LARPPDDRPGTEGSARRRSPWLTFTIFAAALLLAAASAVAYLVVIYPAERGTGTGTAAVTIGPATTLRDVANQLARDRLVLHPWTFALYGRALGAQSKLRQGRILVMRGMTARELLQRVAVGLGSAAVRITIPEGWTRYEIATRLAEWGLCERAAFIRVTEDPQLLATIDPRAQSAEGFLFPDTYWLSDALTPRAIADKLIANGRKRWAALEQTDAEGIRRVREELGFGSYEIFTLASIVEKEAHVPSEQPIIAGVFLNRLRDPKFKPKRLQADPTVAYGCVVQPSLPSCALFDGRRVTRVMTADPANPYNTYRVEGLPPGPIGSPGSSALRAVLEPATHGYFYFVARGDGRHAFTSTLESHGQEVQRAAANRALAEGLSNP